MNRICAAAFLLILFFYTTVVQAEVYKQVRINHPDNNIVTKVLRLGLEPIYGQPGSYVDFAINEDDMPAFIRLHIPYLIIHDDLTAFYQSRNSLGTTMGGYRTFAEMTAVMDSFAALYPNFCSPKFSIATTEQGRSLWVMKVSDNPGIDEDEPEAFICAIIHAREPIGGEICLEFMRYLFTNYGSDSVATNLINNYQLYFCPVMNPDGYEYNRLTNPGGGGMWRKNRHNCGDGNYGVDLNRNFSFFWGYDDIGSSPNTGSETYRGSFPASEPENSGIQDFVNAHDFGLVLNYHAYGNLFLFPWGYYDAECADNAFYDTLGAYSQSIGYSVGSPWELLYNTNGDICDWGYGEDRLHKKCFSEVIEVGDNIDGFWPPQNRIAPLILENRGILKDLLPRALDSIKRRLPLMPTITGPPMQIPNTPFYLYWEEIDSDTFNLPINRRVTMLTSYSRGSQTFENTIGFTLNGFTRNNSYRHGGLYSAYSGQGNNLRNSVIINERLKVQSGDSLKFWARYNMELNYDYAYIEASTDGGITWWQLDGNLSSSNDPHRRNRGNGITGTTNGSWVQGTYPLRDYEGQEIKIKFSYWTDASVVNEGIYIDDFFPCDIFGHTTLLADNVNAESLLVGPFGPGPRYFKVEARNNRGAIGPPSNRYLVDIRGDIRTLTGNVRLHGGPGNPSGTVITLAPINLFDTTDAEGNYSIFVPPGSYNIIAAHEAYLPDTVFSFPIFMDTTLNFDLEQAPPGQPALLLPLNNSMMDTEFVALDWADVPYATGYVLEISTSSDFTGPVIVDSGLIISNYINTQPFANNSYYWRVTAFNQAGYSQHSETRSFAVNIVLDTPRLFYPPDEFLSTSSYIDFDWADVHRADRYLIEFANDSLFVNIIRRDSTLTESAYRNRVPFQIHPYYWRVTAFGLNRVSPRSEVRSFNLNVAIAAPVLSAPARNLLTNNPHVNFDWNDVVGAVSYVFEVSTDSLFSNQIIVDSTVMVSAFSAYFPDGRYFWRVTAFNGLVYSDRSEVRSFNLLTSLQIPELISPVNGYVADSNRVDFSWSNIGGASFYILEVALDSNFTNYTIDDSTRSGTAYSQAGPLANGLYFWRVTASNGLVFSPRSVIRGFDVEVFGGISTPALLSPANGFVSSSPYISFDWSDIGSGVVFLFELSSNPQFTGIIIADSSLTASSYSNVAALDSGGYFWRVRGRSGVHWSEYSDTWAFSVENAPDYMPGDANNSESVNGLDVIYLINYLKGGGPAPSPFLAGDANGSCSVNGLDVVYLVSYFKGGPNPYGGNCLLRVVKKRLPAEQ